MGRGKNPTNFVSLETKKLTRSCAHYKEGFCSRQHRQCSNKSHFYENCIVFQGNKVLNSFLRQRKHIELNEPEPENTVVAQVELPVQEEMLVETQVIVSQKIENVQTIAPQPQQENLTIAPMRRLDTETK